MRPLMSKIVRSIASRGTTRTLKLCTIALCDRIRPGAPSSRRAAISAARERDLDFDRKWGIETAGIDYPERSDVRSRNWIHGARYQAIDPDAFVQVLDSLSIQYERFVFIDFGSGKGRAILLAAGFPFKRVIGIEYAARLHRIARLNCLRYPNDAKKSESVEIIQGDAAEFQLPQEPLVLFLYNPFGRPVMKKVVSNVADSFQRKPRRMVVIYFCSDHADLWDSSTFLRRTRSSSWPAVYDTGEIAARRT
jgi:hypothetical protein